MKNLKKYVALLLAAAMVLALAGCGSKEVVSNARSEDAGLYISASGSTVVDKYNYVTANYSLDKKGNIVNANGDVAVAAENTSSYIPVEGFTVNYTNTLSFPVTLLVNGAGEVQPANVELKAAISPATATCKEIEVKSDNPDVVEVSNASYYIGAGSDSVTFSVKLKSAGTATLTVKPRSSEGAAFETTLAISATTSGSGLPTGISDPNGTTGDPNAPADPTASANPTASPSPSPSAGANAIPEGTGQTGYVTGDGVNFREGASTTSKVISTLAWGKQITIYSISNGWANVVVDGRAGYISASYVSYTKPTTAPTAAPAATSDPYADGASSGNSGTAATPTPTPAPTATPAPDSGDTGSGSGGALFG